MQSSLAPVLVMGLVLVRFLAFYACLHVAVPPACLNNPASPRLACMQAWWHSGMAEPVSREALRPLQKT